MPYGWIRASSFEKSSFDLQAKSNTFASLAISVQHVSSAWYFFQVTVLNWCSAFRKMLIENLIEEVRRLFSKESSLTIYTNQRKMQLFAISGNKVSVAWKEKQFLIVTYISSCKKVDWHLARRIATGFFRNLGLNFEKNQSCMHFLALSVHENSHARTLTEDIKIE